MRYDKNVPEKGPQYKVNDIHKNKFNGPFEIKEIFKNSAVLYNLIIKQS